MKLAFVDTETTGLDPERHAICEIALIVVDGETVSEHQWWLDVSLHTAEPAALRINRYYERVGDQDVLDPRGVAAEVAPLVADAVLIGANPAFDARFLEGFLRRHGQAPAWHYRTFDVETAAAAVAGIEPPWGSSTELCQRALNVVPPASAERHTAMGDCRWAKAVYDAVYHGARSGGQRRARKPAPTEATGRTPHPLVSASPKAFRTGLAKLDDPAVLRTVLEDALAANAVQDRIDAIGARLAEVEPPAAPEAEPVTPPDASPEERPAPPGRPKGMPGEDERPPCATCGRETQGPRKPGAPSAGQLSWTRYRKVLCWDCLDDMKVS